MVIEVPIAAPVGEVWRAMVEDVGAWWRGDFLVCEGSLGMTLEPRVGGLLFERSPGGDGCGLAWGQVIAFQPEQLLAYVAQIVPPFGGPAQSVVQLALGPDPGDPAGATVLTLTDSLIGHVGDELLGCLGDGWLQLFGDGGLKGYVERGGAVRSG